MKTKQEKRETRLGAIQQLVAVRDTLTALAYELQELPDVVGERLEEIEAELYSLCLALKKKADK